MLCFLEIWIEEKCIWLENNRFETTDITEIPIKLYEIRGKGNLTRNGNDIFSGNGNQGRY